MSSSAAASTENTARISCAVLAALSLLVAAPALAGTVSFNTSLIAHEPITPATDVSASGDLVFVGRAELGVSILDISNASNPTVLSTWDHPTVDIMMRDARPIGNVLWCSNETVGDFGCFALDITNPSSPSLIIELAPPIFPGRVHNLWPDGNHLYLSGTFEPAGNFIVDVTTPTSPSVLSRIEREVHDNSVVGDSLYHSGGFSGLYFYDVSNPALPVELGDYTSTSVDTTYYAHNAYPIPGTPYVFLTEEVQKPIAGPFRPGSTRLIDFSDPQNPVSVWRYKSESQKTSIFVGPHNAYVVGDFMYLSHYQDGVKIFDVSVPEDPVEVAFYDTFPDFPVSLFQGCWGVYPFQGPDRIFLSDRTYGYFHVSFNEARRSEIFGRILDASTMLPIEGAVFESVTAARTTGADALGDYVFKTGSGLHQIQVTADGYIPNAEAITFTPNGSIDRDFLLSATAVDVPDAGPLVRLAVRVSPNPTDGVATLTYDIPDGVAGNRFEVGVYDVSGRRIRALSSGLAVAGTQRVAWDGRSDAGFRVANGVYIVRTAIGEESLTERLVVRR